MLFDSRRLRLFRAAAWLGAGAAVYSLAPARASAQVVRAGTEFQVNTYTPTGQVVPSIATASNGDFVVVWQSSDGQDGSLGGIFARRFSSAGVALASEFQANIYTTQQQGLPSVAAGPGGDFVVTWSSYKQDGGYGNGVFARRFSAAGTAIATEFQVTTYTSNSQGNPVVAKDGDGDFAIAWNSGQDGDQYGVFARRFSSSGVAIASEVQVNTFTANDQRRPSVASSASGDFVVAWESYGEDGDSAGVFARRISSSGAPLAGEFQVNIHTESYQGDPAVAVDADGDFVITWTSYQDGSSYGIFGRRYSSAGVALTGEFQVNGYVTNYQLGSSVESEADGDFVVAWFSFGQDGNDNGIFARRFSSGGFPLTPDFQVNTYTTSNQRAPDVARVSGSFVAAWSSLGQDGATNGVFAQRFSILLTLDIDGNGRVEALTDGLLALRWTFGFRGNTLVGGAVDLIGCTRCNAATIEAYLSSLTD